MTHKRNGVSRRMAFIWCLLGGSICLFAPAGWTGRLQMAYADTFRWPPGAARHLSLATAGMPALHTTDSTADKWEAERQALKNKISTLQAQVTETQREKNELSGVRAQPQWERILFLSADVRPGSTQDTLFINRGQKDNVAQGQYVMADYSIIGTVSRVYPGNAVVRLFTDEGSQIPARIGESNLAGIVEGRGRGLARIPQIPATHTVREHDKVTARVVPGLLDAPFVIGTVTRCRPDLENPLLLDIAVQPACDIATLTRVLVILPGSRQQ